MNLGKSLRRPNQGQMLDYVESLVDRKPVPSSIAGAVSASEDTASEARAMRDTLEFLSNTPDIEPSGDLTRRILLEARDARRPERQAAFRRASALQAILGGTVYVGAMSFVCLVVFSAAVYSPPEPEGSRGVETSAVLEADAGFSAESLQDTADEVRVLSAVVGREPSSASASPDSWRHMRAISAMDADIIAALEALERNPGCDRATKVVYSSLQRQADSLREVYVERKL